MLPGRGGGRSSWCATRFGGRSTAGRCTATTAGWATTAAWDWRLRFGLGGVGCAGSVPLASPLGAGGAAAGRLWTLARWAGRGGGEWSCVAPALGARQNPIIL